MGLPKSGTTLVQRVLARHHQISSTSEPWILLPPLHVLQPRGSVSEYGVRSCRDAIKRLMQELPGGRENYLHAVAAMARTIYESLSTERSLYFLDKTPRYHLIAKDIVDAFPDARFLFVWRNPLSVMASSILHNGDCLRRLRYAEFDLTHGTQNLVSSSTAAGARAIAIRYEDFVTSPEHVIGNVMTFLKLDYDPAQIESFSEMKFNGDRNGVDRTRIEISSLHRWRSVLDTPVRRAFAKRVLDRIDGDALCAQGYDKDDLSKEIAALPISRWQLKEIPELIAANLKLLLQWETIRTSDRSSIFY
jgi:hypothetical protein